MITVFPFQTHFDIDTEMSLKYMFGKVYSFRMLELAILLFAFDGLLPVKR
jgi:hypothetical protein